VESPLIYVRINKRSGHPRASHTFSLIIFPADIRGNHLSSVGANETSELNGAEFMPISRSAVPCIHRRPRFVSIFIVYKIILWARTYLEGWSTNKWVSDVSRINEKYIE